VDDDNQPTVYQVQPKNQVVSISSDKTTNPNNRAKLVPRKITAGGSDFFLASLVSSFGNGLYLTDLEIEMGANDAWAVLYSRSSNGGLTDVAIKGNAEPSRRQVGVQIQNGAAAYVGGQNEGKASIEGVATGISMLGESTANIYGSLIINAEEVGLGAFNGGSFQISLSSGGKVSAPQSVNLNQGGQGFINSSTADVTIDGNIGMSSSSLSIGGSTVLSDSASIALQDSTLNIYNDNSGISSDRISCTGPSFTAVNSLSMNNSNGNGCLDQPSWKVLIDSMLPPSSVSKQTDTLSSKMVLESRPAGEAKIIRERLQEPLGIKLRF